MNKTLGQRFFHILQKEKKLQNSNSPNNLPSISLNQLEKQVYQFKKKKNLKQNSDDPSISNNKQLNVCSPFYDRMKTHKQHCKCPYHRKQRFSVTPVKRTEKKAFIIKKSVQKIKQSRDQNPLQRFSNKQLTRQSKQKVFNKSLDCIDDPQTHFSRSQNQKAKSKVESRNFAYEMFLKDCEYHLLKKKGFTAGKPAHIVRKGIQEIFEFINSNLDWSAEKMAQWVNGIEKDRDYGEFYIERFHEMKKNYELALRRKRGEFVQDEEEGDGNQGSNTFVRNANSTGTNFKSKQALTAIWEANSRRYKSMNNGSNEQQDDTTGGDRNKRRNTNNIFKPRHFLESRQLSSQGKQKQGSNILAQQFLNKIFDDLRDLNTISNEVTQALMGLGFQSFKEIFQRLQKNIANDVYTDQMLAKLQTGVISELLKICNISLFKDFGKDASTNKDTKDAKSRKSSQDLKQSLDQNDRDFRFHRPTTSDVQKKVDIIKKTQDILKKHRSRKYSNLSQRTSFNANGNSKHLLGSKRNTQDTPGQNARSATAVSHSKKSSNGDFSLTCSQKNLDTQKDDKIIITTQNKFGTIDEAIQIDEQHLTDEQRRRLKALGLLGPQVRRSRMMRPGQIFKFLRQGLDDYNDGEDDDLLFRKQSVELKRGYFTKAEKYLFDINMDRVIIKNDDSLFTAKRKMRVIKLVLKQSPNAPEADVLKNYVNQIEQKIWMKTQKDKNQLQKKKSQVGQMKDQQIWNSITLENLGFDLIFYNISSHIRVEDNEDLCILLNQWKLINMRRLENRVSFKMDLIIGEDELNKKKKKTVIPDILIQEDMRNMEFEPKLDSFRDMSPLNQSKVTTMTFGKKHSDPISTAKDSKMSGFYSQISQIKGLRQDDLQGLDEQFKDYYNRKVKGVFKYAKVHFPEAFGRYVKNSSLNNNPFYSLSEF